METIRTIYKVALVWCYYLPTIYASGFGPGLEKGSDFGISVRFKARFKVRDRFRVFG